MNYIKIIPYSNSNNIFLSPILGPLKALLLDVAYMLS